MKRTIIIDDRPEVDARVRGGRGSGHVVRVVLSLGCALAADGLQWLIPPAWVICDGAMVFALLLIWGWRWEIVVAVMPEIIPGLALFPTWTLFVGYLAFVRPKEGVGGAVRNPTPGTPRPMKRVEPL